MLEPLHNLQAVTDPAAAPAESSGKRPLGELVSHGEIGNDGKLFAQRRSTTRTVALESLELSLDPTPGLHDDPDLVDSLGLQREETLEAIDEQETLSLLKDEERLLWLERRLCRVALKKLK